MQETVVVDAGDIPMVVLSPQDQEILHKKFEDIKKRHLREEVLFWLGKIATLGFVALSGLRVLKYFIPGFSMPVSIVTLAANLKTMVQKKKSRQIIAGFLFFGLLDLLVSVGFDLAKWGVTFAGASSLSLIIPVIVTVVFAGVAAINGVNFFRSLSAHLKNPRHFSPLQKFELANKAVNAVTFAIIAVCIPPLVLFPPLAIIFAPIALTAFSVFLAMKIVEHVVQKAAWKTTIADFSFGKKIDPYELLGINKNILLEKLDFEKRVAEAPKKSIVERLKEFKTSIFGTDEEKIKLKPVAGYIQQRYEDKVAENTAKFNGDPARLLKLQMARDLLISSDGRIAYDESQQEDEMKYRKLVERKDVEVSDMTDESSYVKSFLFADQYAQGYFNAAPSLPELQDVTPQRTLESSSR
jgi:hypothetical protein